MNNTHNVRSQQSLDNHTLDNRFEDEAVMINQQEQEVYSWKFILSHLLHRYKLEEWISRIRKYYNVICPWYSISVSSAYNMHVYLGLFYNCYTK